MNDYYIGLFDYNIQNFVKAINENDSKNLQAPQSKYKELDGITAHEYLDKAKTMFEEMDLQWDLNELEKSVND